MGKEKSYRERTQRSTTDHSIVDTPYYITNNEIRIIPVENNKVLSNPNIGLMARIGF